MKQGANSAVRFTSYAFLQQTTLTYTKPVSGKLTGTTTFGLGAIAGLITVCESMSIPQYLDPDDIRYNNAAGQHQDTYAVNRGRDEIQK